MDHGTTTEDLIATVAADRDDMETFYARAQYSKRTGSDWRHHAPVKPRSSIDGCHWHNFCEGD